MSKDLMLLISSIIPEDVIIEQLQEALTQHKIIPSAETKSKLAMYCMMFLSKDVTDKHGYEKVSKECEEMSDIHKRLNTPKN